MERFTDKLYQDRLNKNNLSEKVSKAVETWLSYKFAVLFEKSFEDWGAYHLGLIDSSGNIIKNPTTYEEKRTLGSFDNLVRKVKKTTLNYCEESECLNTLLLTFLVKEESTENSLDMKMEIAYDLETKELEMMENILVEMRKNLLTSDK